MSLSRLSHKVYADGLRNDVGLYVDDTWAVDNAGKLADDDWHALESMGFKFTLEPAHHFLNMNVVVHSSSRVSISMEAYIKRMADTYLPDWRERDAVQNDTEHI